ncbi:MAG: hypothetical protein J7501_08015 [Bdellovibrio sp.]|nr:hypothetical protein [Bdellovibrio sp.]
MNKNWMVVIAGCCLILGFQNCSQSGLSQGDFASLDVHAVTPSVGSGEESSEDAQAITSVEIPFGQNKLRVQADSGRIDLFDSAGQLVEEGCLGSVELSELQSYIKPYNICGAPAQDADRVCAQTYTAGYASLVMGQQRMNLGEMFDSCGSGYKDLCGDQAQSFRGLVAYMQKNFYSLNCQ